MSLLPSILVLLLLLAAGLLLFTRWTAAKVERAFLPPGEFLEVEGERIHYRAFGAGPPMVMVHGLAGNLRNFDYLPWQELGQRHRIVLLDRPGAGLSPRHDGDKAGIAAQARLVAGFLRALRFEQKPLLVGHSLGGAIALGVALQDPDCICGLALIAPLTHYNPVVPAPFRPLQVRAAGLRAFIGHVLAVPFGRLMMRQTLEGVFAPEPVPADFPHRGGGLLGLRPQAFIEASRDLCAVEQDLVPQQPRYGGIRLPVHVLYGDQDAVLDWREQGEGLLRALPAAHLEVIPGAGHMVPVTHAARTAAWLEAVAQSCRR